VPDESALHFRLFASISQTSSELRSVFIRDFLTADAKCDRGGFGYGRDCFAAAACIDAQLNDCIKRVGSGCLACLSAHSLPHSSARRRQHGRLQM